MHSLEVRSIVESYHLKHDRKDRIARLLGHGPRCDVNSTSTENRDRRTGVCIAAFIVQAEGDLNGNITRMAQVVKAETGFLAFGNGVFPKTEDRGRRERRMT